MSKVVFNIPGLKAKFDNLIEQKLEVAGALMESTAKLLAPVDKGYLREHITHTTRRTQRGFAVRATATADYAIYVEFGTGERAENGKGRKGGWFFVSTEKELAGWLKPIYKTKEGKYVYFTYGQHPQPFMRPALFNNKQQLISIFNSKQ